ncbi:LysM peptidoglycan-binding domain-containing protein [Bacillus cabrialesii]|uniref:LysM peptidoglycan-binding domain-containing protein n=1 Tax=Bacillus cabrialesii TaxID=2487276 RepID=UPI001C03F265|nr:LysM peptidoglycan-binding domain-containing protein [Bacillus cabrialesii]MBU2658427.1 LysM peptidoglycan-binding domain-containing protein [Bacillus cabrialesii]
MPQNHRLQFSVEESICFQKGQEVSELLSISLDPDIRVQEVNDYVSIRGSLELTGEYNIDQNKHTEEFYSDKRFVEEVRKREDGSAELTHCFPVDITIPKNKVSHLQDVFVFIDAFDYQLTDSRILTIQADLAIEGLLDDTAVKEPEIPLYEAPAAFREDEPSEPPIQSAVETDAPPAVEVLKDETPAEPPELFVSKAGLREELETEKAESEPPEFAASEPEAREDAEPPELVAQEVYREESETKETEPEASEIEIQEIVKTEKETSEPAAALADVREEADSPAEPELCEDSRTEESPALEAELHGETESSEEKAEKAAAPILEHASRQEGHLEHVESALRQEEKEAEHAEPALCQEEKEAEHAEPALRQEEKEAEHAEPALRQEEKEAEHAEPALRQEEKEAEHAEPALRQEEKEAEYAEPAFRQEEKEAEHAEPALRQEAEEAPETVAKTVLSVEESREKKPGSAAYSENEEETVLFHFSQKASSEEASQEEAPVPAYRAFLPEQEEEDSFYSAPKLLEEKEREEESFEIEVRKIAPAEESEEETPLQSFQLPDTSETERKEEYAVPRVAPAAETKEPHSKESNNSLYLTKLFTREEDEFSRMKICIVQQEDTIERLCERYEITSQQLIRMNSLALDDELKAGQILYIPQYNNSHA